MRKWTIAGAVACLALVMAGAAIGAILSSPVPLHSWLAHPVESFKVARGENPFPVRLARPPIAPLSEMAQLGKQIFFDTSLSSSGQLSCASCHGPDHAYGPSGDAPAVNGGPTLSNQGQRAVPSLMYLEHQPNFSIGPDNDEDESVSLAQLVALSKNAPRAQKTADNTQETAANMVPQGGLFWDGRSDTLQDQAQFPLTNPIEMDGGSIEAVAAKLHHAPYRDTFVQLFGKTIFDSPRFAVAEALFAVARYEIEEPSFHPYTSKFDFWLEGRARFTPTELRGYLLFNEKTKANCGGCHVDKPTPDGLPPVFTDHQYEALGAPRNMALAANRDPAYFDLGVCGPVRTDIGDQPQYCGMFTTPTLRNVATRKVFFHNGVFHTLQQVMDFYDFRDTNPERIYPRNPDGTAAKFNDIPAKYADNIDVVDPPFDRNLGEAPAMTPQDESDIIAFLQTLTDGYKPAAP